MSFVDRHVTRRSVNLTRGRVHNPLHPGLTRGLQHIRACLQCSSGHRRQELGRSKGWQLAGKVEHDVYSLHGLTDAISIAKISWENLDLLAQLRLVQQPHVPKAL